MILLLLLSGGACSAAVFDITDYGANPNDGVDDLAAIHATMNAAGVGDTVYMPAGTFDVSSQVNLNHKQQKLLGAGRDATTIRYMTTGVSNSTVIEATTLKNNIEIAHFTIDGNSKTTLRTGLSFFDRITNSYIHDMRIMNITSDELQASAGIRFAYSCTGNVIENNLIENINDLNREQGAGISVGNLSSDNRIIGNTIDGAGRYSIFCRDVAGLVVSGNQTTNSGVFGIEAMGCSNGVYEDNTIDKWISVGGASNIAIRRNFIGNTVDPNPAFAGIETGSGSQNIIVTDNVIDDGQSNGIALPQATDSHVLIAHNDIGNVDERGLSFANTHQAYMYQNDIRDGGGFGVNLYDWGTGYLVFDDNTIADNASHGINVQSLDDYVTVINNTITGNSWAVHNTLTADPGAYPGAHVQWSGNTVTGHANNNEWTPAGYDNATPTIDIDCPTRAIVGQDVAFLLNFADTDGTFARALWDFDDGLPGTVENPTYAYEEPGTYRITAVAWDDYGRGVIDTAYITIFAPIPGDLNSDGFVGGADMDIIRSFWGQTVTPGNLLHGDPSGNGICSGQDLDIVRAHWGEGTPPAVPEPSALILLAGALASFIGRHSKRPHVDGRNE